jgi:phosphate transport system substrate-binding protein
VAGWICNCVLKNGDRSFSLNFKQDRQSYFNYGTHCEICGLPKESVIANDEHSEKCPLGAQIALLTGAIVALSVLAIGYLMRPATCLYGQTRINGKCVAVNSNSVKPTSPNNSERSSPLNPNANSIETFSSLAAVFNVPTMKARYGGSTSFAPLRTDRIVGLIAMAQPGFELIYVEPPSGHKPGSSSGIKMLLDGQLSFAQSSRPLREEEYNAAKNRGFSLEQKAVAIDGIAVFVNPQLSLPGLSLSQLKDIYTGKITNWEQVGGLDLAVNLVSRDPQSGGTPEYFQETVLDRQQFAKAIKTYARDSTDLIRKVAHTPGAIGYATTAEICNQSIVKSLAIATQAKQNFVNPCDGKQVNQVAIANNLYPITRRLFVIIKRDSTIDEQAGISYVNLLLSEEGQQLIEEAGLVRIR